MSASTRIPLPKVGLLALASQIPRVAHPKACAHRPLSVYSKDMPDRLPVLLIMRQVSNQIVSAILFVLRAALVATVWLAALPWLTIWTWRFYFTIGNTACVVPSHNSDLTETCLSSLAHGG